MFRAISLPCLTVLLIGCAGSTRSDRAAGDVSEARAASSEPGSAAPLPGRVRTAFDADVPGARVTDVRRVTTLLGEPYYRIAFVADGEPGRAAYTATGERIPAAPPAVILPPHSQIPAKPESGISNRP
jgi:hypothetical protein